MKTNYPTQSELNNLFEYKNGQIFHKARGNASFDNRYAGTRAGTEKSDGKGYTARVVKVNRKAYPEHSIIWIMANGEIPEGFTIDHIDTNPLNNLLSNFRLASKSEQGANRKVSKRKASGLPKGVSLTRDGKYRARIRKDGKQVVIGTYGTVELAKEAYDQAALECHGEFARV